MAGKIQQNSQEFLEKVNALYNNEYELISYSKAREPATLKHIPCGNIITKRSDSWYRTSCDYCRTHKSPTLAAAA